MDITRIGEEGILSALGTYYKDAENFCLNSQVMSRSSETYPERTPAYHPRLSKNLEQNSNAWVYYNLYSWITMKYRKITTLLLHSRAKMAHHFHNFMLTPPNGYPRSRFFPTFLNGTFFLWNT